MFGVSMGVENFFLEIVYAALWIILYADMGAILALAFICVTNWIANPQDFENFRSRSIRRVRGGKDE